MHKIFKKCLIILPILPVLILAAESVYFLTVLSGNQEIDRADLIVVFQGRHERVQAAYELMAAERASHLVVSPASRKQLEFYDQQFEKKQRFEKIIEDKARTTFENALFTRQIVRNHGINTVILVTSWNHMPRSYLLLNTMLIGSGIKIQTHCVPTGILEKQNWHRHSVGWKMIYNEMVECWGSLIELVKYEITGKLPRNSPGKSGILGGLRKWVLFDIKPEELN